MTASTKPLADVFREGQTASLDGAGMDSNPYPRGTFDFGAWRDGFMAPHGEVPIYKVDAIDGRLTAIAAQFIGPGVFEQVATAAIEPDGGGFQVCWRRPEGDMALRLCTGQIVYLCPEDAEALTQAILEVA